MARYTTSPRRALAGFAFVGAALAAGGAWAESVQQTLSQLANASPNATQLGLRSRGYAQVASDAAGDRAWQYWWNGREIACVMLATTGGRVDRLAATSETDCNQMAVDPTRISSSGKVAMAAAKQLGVGSLMHKSHQRDTARYNDAKTVADFELGYRDAFSRANYRDRDRSNKAYADGFKAGQAKSVAIAASGADFELGFRDGFNKVEYRDRDRKNKRYADGYKAGQTEGNAPGTAALGAGRSPFAAPVALPPPTRVGDLVGRNAADLEAGMKSLGYTRRAGFTKGKESFSTWRGNTESQCVRIVVRDGKVQDAGDVEESSCL